MLATNELTGTELTSWWNEESKKSGKILQELVNNHPSWWGMGLVITRDIHRSSIPSAGFVHVAPLGQAAPKYHGSRRWGRTPRLPPLGVMGVGLVAHVVQIVGIEKNLITNVFVNSSPSAAYASATYVSTEVNEAINQKGDIRLFAAVSDLTSTKKLNRSASTLADDNLWRVAKRLGADIRTRNLSSITDLIHAATTTNGVVLFSVCSKSSGRGSDSFRSYYAFKYAFKKTHDQVVYAERSGKICGVLSRSTFSDAASLEKSYLVINDMKMIVPQRSPDAELVMAVKKAHIINADEITPQAVLHAFDVMKKITHKTLETLPVHIFQANDKLAELAQHYYHGDAEKWAAIFVANRRIFKGDSHYKPIGAEISIPKI